ncbi:MAG TPA: MFS transporter [Thermohalobaculum sp.]|nr:MFS transporter [Thermohalobaculum sp.]
MGTLVSFAALFVSVFLVQLGSGTLGPLDALAGGIRGYSASEIGLMGSAHFVGFLAGCFLAPRYIGSVGHARGFAAAAAIGAIGPLLHPVLEGPYYWAGLRMLTGFAIASAYTVIESWLQAKCTNENRGRVYGSFRVVDLVGQITAQGMIAVLDPASYTAYNIVTVFACLCLIPLALTRSVPPKVPESTRLRPLRALRLSPSAAVGIVVAGMTGAAFRMIGPVYAVEMGLDQGQIALFLAMAVVGGVVAQVPTGWIADKVDRRLVLVGLSAAAVASATWIVLWVEPGMATAAFIGAFLFGATSLPLYSVSAAYANDFAEADFIVELNASLIFFFSLGAIASPLLTARLISLAGPEALFLFVAVAHLALIAFALYRMTRRAAAQPRSRYTYLPRTSIVLGRLFAPSNGGPEKQPERREP